MTHESGKIEVINPPEWIGDVLREIVRQNSEIVRLLAMTKVWIPQGEMDAEKLWNLTRPKQSY